MSRILKNGKKKRTMKNKRNTRRKSTKRNRKSRRVKRSINQYRKKQGGGPKIVSVEVDDGLIEKVKKYIQDINHTAVDLPGFEGRVESDDNSAKKIIRHFIKKDSSQTWEFAMFKKLEDIKTKVQGAQSTKRVNAKLKSAAAIDREGSEFTETFKELLAEDPTAAKEFAEGYQAKAEHRVKSMHNENEVTDEL
tara:strand:- start:155 stop:733 length:579 start_codon:yes stop_codon:yes gene_type:complete